jgi:hypothetical protein
MMMMMMVVVMVMMMMMMMIHPIPMGNKTFTLFALILAILETNDILTILEHNAE